MMTVTKKAAEKLKEVATITAKQTVGKSIPWYMYEPKVPEKLKH